MNIFITGCAGFIGSSLAEKLVEQNHCVIGLDNFDSHYPKEFKLKNLQSLETNSNFKFYFGDIRDTEILNTIFNNHPIDIVVHLAAKAGVRTSFEIPQQYVDVNINGTINIMEAMKQHNIQKLVFASSSSVYGNANADKFSEDLCNLSPISPYAATKKAGEEIIKIYTENSNIQAVCLRFFTVYGPKQRPDLAIHKFSDAIIHNKPLPMYGDGNTYRDYTYIDDTVAGIISAMNYNQTPFEIINLGSGNPISLKELISSIETEIGKKAQIEHLSLQPGDVQKTYADITKAAKLLNYKPQTSFAAGLRRFIQYTFSREEQ